MKRLLVIFFSLFTIAVSAGTLTINGNDCGEVELVTLNPTTGDIALKAGGNCAGGVIVEPPPVVTPPPATNKCPAGVRCIERGWPTIPQETFALRSDEVLSIKVKTADVGTSGRIATNYSVGDTGTRVVALSKIAGDFNGTPACVKTGFEATSTQWQVNGTSTWRCQVEPNATYFVNVKFTTCAVGALCKFTLSASK